MNTEANKLSAKSSAKFYGITVEQAEEMAAEIKQELWMGLKDQDQFSLEATWLYSHNLLEAAKKAEENALWAINGFNIDDVVLLHAIRDLGPLVQSDAKRCAADGDLVGLVYIANMAVGNPGHKPYSLNNALGLQTLVKHFL